MQKISEMQDTDIRYMRRALALARLGEGTVWSNQMVGAVIADPSGRIIGEGWHRRYGEGHAEVNAIASVAAADQHLLSESTIYVTLEPCAHYGKTPPCAKLIIDTGIPRVVIGCGDPFAKVSGRGIAMLREAGREVTCGILEDECRKLNVRFFTAHTLKRPYILLKWAQTSDGIIGIKGRRLCISNKASSMEVHRIRSTYQAILAGSGTILADNPRLDSRLWPLGRTPMRITIDRRGRIPATSLFFRDEGFSEALYVGGNTGRTDLPDNLATIEWPEDEGLPKLLRNLYDRGIISVMVEGGSELLNTFIDQGLWDEARVETNPLMTAACHDAIYAPRLSAPPASVRVIDGNIIQIFANASQNHVKNL